MDFFISETKVREVPAVREDKDKLIQHHQGLREGIVKKDIPEEIKEQIATEVLTTDINQYETAKIYGVSQKVVSDISNGKGMSEELSTKILATKYDIQELATTRLLKTLNLLDPEAVTKVKDRIALMRGLSQVMHQSSANETGSRTNIQVIAYMPEQKKIEEYKIIEV